MKTDDGVKEKVVNTYSAHRIRGGCIVHHF